MAGSWGILGRDLRSVAQSAADQPRLRDSELRVRREPSTLSTRAVEITTAAANASSWHSGCLRVRLSGARAAVRVACATLGGGSVGPDVATAWWSSIRDQTHDFFSFTAADFAAGECLWRLSVPASSPPLELAGRQFIEWNGAQRWWRTPAAGRELREAAARVGGHATLVRGPDKLIGAFAPLSPALMRIHRGLKLAFDPAGIFNHGRLYAEL